MFMVAENLVNTERRMLKAMLEDANKNWTLGEILDSCDWHDQAVAVGAGQGLANKGYAEVSEIVSTEVRLAPQGESAMNEGLLEARLWQWFKSTDEATVANMQKSFEKHEAGPGIGLLKKLGITMETGKFTCANEAMVEQTISAREKFLSDLPSKVSDLDGQLLDQFKSRRNFIELVDSTSRTWSLTKSGSQVKVGDLVETTMVCLLYTSPSPRD